MATRQPTKDNGLTSPVWHKPPRVFESNPNVHGVRPPLPGEIGREAPSHPVQFFVPDACNGLGRRPGNGR